MKPIWCRAAEFAGLEPSDRQNELMQRYGDWLRVEGLRAGGIGPGERERIERRHLADSVLFASQLPRSSAHVWDLGSGVGLPGVPLAILLPDTDFRLIDRSGGRVDLLRRVTRVLELENCQVVQGEIGHLEGEADAIVSRATLPPAELLALVEPRLVRGGIAIAGGSWRRRPDHIGWRTVEIPPYVLDQTIWLLIMRRE